MLHKIGEAFLAVTGRINNSSSQPLPLLLFGLSLQIVQASKIPEHSLHKTHKCLTAGQGCTYNSALHEYYILPWLSIVQPEILLQLT